MHLKSLTCKGFKSFADRSVMNLEPGITAIIGPNGSGKSNVLDAVLWVLGERNARNLRGQAMEDVIFAGSSTRKHVGMAEVVLVLDNSDGTLPVDYDEVAITRRIYRSGEGEYLINGAPCRRMDVLDILHDSGLGAGTHSIISQGHLDGVLQSRPEDRRDLIEEAAGVLKHKQRKARSERKLERMDQHLLRIRDVTHEVERQLKPLERKAKRAATYQGLASELAEVSLDLAVDELRTLQGRWQEATALEVELAATVKGASEEAAGADERMQDMQRQMQRQAEGAGEAAGDLQRVSRACEQLDSASMLLREKKRSALRVRDERQLQLQADAGRLEQAERARAQAHEALEEVSGQLASAREELAGISRERDEVSRAFADLRKEQGSAEQREAQLGRDIDRLQAARDKAAEALSSGIADGKLLAAQVADAAKRIDQARERADELDGLHRKAEGELARALELDEECRARQGELLSAVDGKRAALGEARLELARHEAQAAGLEEAERTARAANRAFSRALESRESLGAGKLLLEAVEIPADALFVVEMLLADAVDALMVEGAESARAGLRALADAGEEGSVALLAAEGAQEAAGVPLVPEGAVRLMDVLSCDEDARPAIGRLLGDVVLCETAADASRCAREMAAAGGRWRVAGKDGSVISSNGLHRLARAADGAVGALERHRELEQARAKAGECAGQVARLEGELAKAEEQLRESQREGLERASERAKAQGTRDSLAQQAAQARLDLANGEAQLEELDRRRERNEQLLEQMRPDSERIAAEIDALQAQRVQVRERLEELREEVQPLRRRSGRLNEEHTEARLEVGKLAEREGYERRMVQGHEGDIARLSASIARARSEVSRAGGVDGVDDIVSLLERVRQGASARIAGIERRADEFRRGAASLHGRSEECRLAALAARDRLDDARERLAAAQVEKGRLEVQVEAAIQTIKQECETPLESALARDALEDRQAAEGRAAALRKRIAGLGPINPDAAREYDELKERYDYLKAQVDDILGARRALERIVDAIDARMRDDFLDTFKQVDANFQRIFAQLFPGGSASLSLLDEDDPEHSGVEVHAQPRGKRIAKMSLMSGGEKSLTALALLFAVYATRPTPFYILDEVEAALDDTNLRRLCSFLDDLRTRTQLIMITHQRRTMEMADVLYGVSMQSDGVTRLISQKLDRATMAQQE